MKRNVVQGMGAGLVAGAGVALLEVVLLMFVNQVVLSLNADQVWQPLAGLLYALIAYGTLGLLGGLGLGLLRGLGHAVLGHSRESVGRSVWAAFVALLFAPGLFLIVRNRVRYDILHTAGRPWSETLLLDGAPSIAVGLGVALGLWLLLRRLLRSDRMARITQPRWNLTAYAVALTMAALLAVAPALAASLTDRGPAATGFPPHLRDAPNIIFIVADTLRADHLSCYGYTENRTPHIDALTRDGVLYRDMSAQASWTKPSVATMLTSLYPSSHRASGKLDSLPDAVTMLPEMLHERGYRTSGFTTNPQTSSRFNFQQGYDEYVYLEHIYPFFASSVSSRFAVFMVFRRLRRALQPPTAIPHDEMYQDAATLTQQALAWLEANRGTRFFLYLHYMDPHVPYYAHPYDGRTVGRVTRSEPDPAEAPAMRRLYDGEVTFLDTHLGELFDQLKAWGLYDDALIIFTADHGEEFYEHRGWGHGTTLYEEQLAVPLIVKYPGNVHAGTMDEEFARSLDLAPTVLDVIGFLVPAAMQGASLRPGAAPPRAEAVFAEEDYRGNVIRSIRTRNHKFITANEDNPRGLPIVALFDLQTDPGEQKNLAPDEPDTVRRLRAKLDQVIAFAEAHAVASQSSELDAATRERLRQLGY